MAEMAASPTSNMKNNDPGILPQAGSLVSQLREMKEQPAFRRALPTILAAAVTVIGLFAYFVMQQPSRTTLFASLPESEKSRVLDALKNSGVDVALDPTTGDVMVPTDDYHSSRIMLAAQGLPTVVPAGYDNLDSIQMGSSRSVEAMRLKQTQEMELARSIAEIDNVLSARVHLAIPEKEVFIRQESQPTASVFVQLAKGRVLGRTQVEAIIHLVSSSVPKLAKEDVSVIDHNGSLLSNSSHTKTGIMNNSELEHRVRMEDIYRSRIISLLTPIVGPGNINAQVNLDIDFTRSEITEEIVDPEGNALRSEQNTNDLTRERPAKGIPGAVANTPPQEPQLTLEQTEVGVSNDTLRSSSSSEVKNYEVSRTVSSTMKPSHRIQKINAAVLIRDEVIIDPETGAKTTLPMSEEMQLKIEKLVGDTIGIDVNRGDSLTVSSSTFIDTLEGVRTNWYETGWFRSTVNQFGMIVILGIIVLGIIRPLLSRILVPASAVTGVGMSDEDEIDLDTVEVGAGESLEDIKAKLKPKKQAISAEMLDTANTYDDKVAVIRMIVADESDRVANVFKSMLNKDMAS
ncbi:MAG: Flagellar M-ring protein [Alphaproteobacteria bacterium UBA4588]|nr:MAG: Flagellar M-ring protein [Alphaproteobacteria bacterium UBA4588]